MKYYKIDNLVIISDRYLSVEAKLIANTTDGTHEKHVLVISTSGDEVKLQSVLLSIPVSILTTSNGSAWSQKVVCR